MGTLEVLNLELARDNLIIMEAEADDVHAVVYSPIYPSTVT